MQYMHRNVKKKSLSFIAIDLLEWTCSSESVVDQEWCWWWGSDCRTCDSSFPDGAPRCQSCLQIMGVDHSWQSSPRLDWRSRGHPIIARALLTCLSSLSLPQQTPSKMSDATMVSQMALLSYLWPFLIFWRVNLSGTEKHLDYLKAEP